MYMAVKQHKQRQYSLVLFENYSILFIQKHQVPHNKLPLITLQACCHLHPDDSGER